MYSYGERHIVNPFAAETDESYPTLYFCCVASPAQQQCKKWMVNSCFAANENKRICLHQRFDCGAALRFIRHVSRTRRRNGRNGFILAWPLVLTNMIAEKEKIPRWFYFLSISSTRNVCNKEIFLDVENKSGAFNGPDVFTVSFILLFFFVLSYLSYVITARNEQYCVLSFLSYDFMKDSLSWPNFNVRLLDGWPFHSQQGCSHYRFTTIWSRRFLSGKTIYYVS